MREKEKKGDREQQSGREVKKVSRNPLCTVDEGEKERARKRMKGIVGV